MTNFPQLPSKYDIIPIHTSDRAAFKACRRKWNWSSPSRHNLVRDVRMGGLNVPMWFGTGIHYALEQYYNPGLQRDPVEAFLQWFDIVYNGGTVSEDWLSRVYDPQPRFIGHPSLVTSAAAGLAVDSGVEYNEDTTIQLYRVKGLNTLLPNEDHTELMEHRELGINMLEFYKDYAKRNDTFEVIAVEHDFSVPIWDFEHDRIFKAVDTREESPNCGNQLDVHYRGRMDAITKSPTGVFGILDHKTKGKIDENWFKTFELDEQATSYLWAAEVEANYYDLPYKKLRDIIFQGLRKVYPKPPTVLKNGDFSIDRTKESTTYDIFQRFLRQAPHWQLLIDTSPKHASYVDYLKEVGDEQFIVRKSVTRNRHQLVSAGQRIYLEAKDMLSNPSIYPNPSGDYDCLNCVFRVPCIATEAGDDFQMMIDSEFVSNKDR